MKNINFITNIIPVKFFDASILIHEHIHEDILDEPQYNAYYKSVVKKSFVEQDQLIDANFEDFKSCFSKAARLSTSKECFEALNNFSLEHKFILDVIAQVGIFYKEYHVEKIPFTSNFHYYLLAYLQESFAHFYNNLEGKSLTDKLKDERYTFLQENQK